MASIATTNNVVSSVLPAMLMSKICQSKKEKDSSRKNTTLYTKTEKKVYFMNELHSIVLRDGSKASLSSFGANAFKNQGSTRPKKHIAPAAMPGVLVNRSTPNPNKKPNKTYTHLAVSLDKMSRKYT